MHYDTVPLIRINPDRIFINLPQSDISNKLGSDGKLTLKEQKKCFNNNLYMYYEEKSY